VVQNLWSFGEFIYDNYLSPEVASRLQTLGQRVAEDLEALAILMQLGKRGGWPIAVSQRTLDELDRIPEPNKRYHVMAWGWEIANYFEEGLDYGKRAYLYETQTHQRRATQLYESNKLGFLPHDKDRWLLLDAIALGCEVFLTMDYHSIWKFRTQIADLGILVMRPTEFLNYIKPWVDLLR
jgi:hypothetical protein